MKISIITSPFGNIPPNTTGAVERLWFNLALEFCKAGHDVEIICRKDNSIRKDLPPNLSIIGVKGYSRTGSLKSDLLLDFIYSARALAKVNKSSILMLNTFWTPLLCGILPRMAFGVCYNIQRFPKGQFKYYKAVDRFYCVSNSVYSTLLKQTPNAAPRACVIGNAVNTDVFQPREMNSDTRAAFRIAYAGRVHPEKGLDQLICAYSLLSRECPELELSIIGARSVGDGGGGCKYVDMLEELADGAAIEWVDPISDPYLLADEIAKCDIFCYPSKAEKGETFGVAPLEAMALGRPVVVSGLKCFQDFVEDGVSGLIYNHTLENAHMDLASKLRSMIQSPDLRKRIAEKGMDEAQNFTNQRIAGRYLEDFLRLVDERSKLLDKKKT